MGYKIYISGSNSVPNRVQVKNQFGAGVCELVTCTSMSVGGCVVELEVDGTSYGVAIFRSKRDAEKVGSRMVYSNQSFDIKRTNEDWNIESL